MSEDISTPPPPEDDPAIIQEIPHRRKQLTEEYGNLLERNHKTRSLLERLARNNKIRPIVLGLLIAGGGLWGASYLNELVSATDAASPTPTETPDATVPGGVSEPLEPTPTSTPTKKPLPSPTRIGAGAGRTTPVGFSLPTHTPEPTATSLPPTETLPPPAPTEHPPTPTPTPEAIKSVEVNPWQEARNLLAEKTRIYFPDGGAEIKIQYKNEQGVQKLVVQNIEDVHFIFQKLSTGEGVKFIGDFGSNMRTVTDNNATNRSMYSDADTTFNDGWNIEFVGPDDPYNPNTTAIQYDSAGSKVHLDSNDFAVYFPADSDQNKLTAEAHDFFTK